MAHRTTLAQRREFFQRHQAGETYLQIAQAMEFSKECVRHWVRVQNKGRPIETRYYRPLQGLLSTYDRKVRYVLLRLRRQHPRWGPGRLRHHLKKRASLQGLGLPSPTQIGRYLHQWPIFRRQKLKIKRQRPNPATQVGQRWQVDFKMGIALGDGSLANLHTVCDPLAGVCLGADVYPAGNAGRVPQKVRSEDVQTTLRHCFARWHFLPGEVQTDGETNLVANRNLNDFPTLFTLWLAGLGIAHRVTRPFRPTDNAEVERMHRTLYEYAVVARSLPHNLAYLQQCLDQALEELAYALPSRAKGCQGLPPLLAHPELNSPRHWFQADWELAVFDLQRVDQFLAGFTWVRKVGKTGQVYLGSQVYTVARSYARQEISIRFDPRTHEMVFYEPADQSQGEMDAQDPEIKRLPARGLDRMSVLKFDQLLISAGPQQLRLPMFEIEVRKG